MADLSSFKKGDTIHIYSTVVENMSIKGFVVEFKNEQISENFYTNNISFILINNNQSERSGLIKTEYMHITKLHTCRMVLFEKHIKRKNKSILYGRNIW